MKIRLLVTLGLLLAASAAPAQDEEKIKKLFEDAIAAMGGEAYLRVTDIYTEGNYFAFNRDGDSSGLIKYNDWTKLPNKSRNELGNKKKLKDVTVFDLEKKEGWILEGQKETRAATPEEMKSFHKAVIHSPDNIFRTRWKDAGNKLFYLGPGEGRDVSLEQVQILDPENDTVTIFFDRLKKFPVRLEYKEMSPRGIQLRHVEEYDQWFDMSGLKVPLRIDHFVNGRKASQLYVTKVTFNGGMPDELFVKPIPPK